MTDVVLFCRNNSARVPCARNVSSCWAASPWERPRDSPRTRGSGLGRFGADAGLGRLIASHRAVAGLQIGVAVVARVREGNDIELTREHLGTHRRFSLFLFAASCRRDVAKWRRLIYRRIAANTVRISIRARTSIAKRITGHELLSASKYQYLRAKNPWDPGPISQPKGSFPFFRAKARRIANVQPCRIGALAGHRYARAHPATEGY
jgi:hypothetical protein